MKPLLTLLLVFTAVTLVGADEPKKEAPKPVVTKEKVVGTWEVTSSTDDKLTGAVVTFSEDDTIRITFKDNGEEKTVSGTWKIEGGKLKTKSDAPDEDTDTVTKLTDDTMELENPREKMKMVLKRK